MITTKTGPSKETIKPFINKGGFIRMRKKKWKELKDVIMNQKVNRLKDIFCAKIKRNNQYSQPVQYQYEKNTMSETFLESKGY